MAPSPKVCPILAAGWNLICTLDGKNGKMVKKEINRMTTEMLVSMEISVLVSFILRHLEYPLVIKWLHIGAPRQEGI